MGKAYDLVTWRKQRKIRTQQADYRPGMEIKISLPTSGGAKVGGEKVLLISVKTN